MVFNDARNDLIVNLGNLLRFLVGKPKQSPVVSQLANSATKSGSTADLLVDFDGAKSNAKAAAPPAAAGDADQKQVNLLDDTPLDS